MGQKKHLGHTVRSGCAYAGHDVDFERKKKAKNMRDIQDVMQKKHLPVKAVQFGEGRLLRGLIEPAFQAAVDQGRFAGSLAIVKPTGRGNLDAFERQSCLYTVVLRGKRDGAAYDEAFPISCVDRAVNPYRDFESFLALARLPELEFVISNTTEAGIVLDREDRFDAVPPASFPGKLTRFLYERYRCTNGDEGIRSCHAAYGADRAKRRPPAGVCAQPRGAVGAGDGILRMGARSMRVLFHAGGSDCERLLAGGAAVAVGAVRLPGRAGHGGRALRYVGDRGSGKRCGTSSD